MLLALKLRRIGGRVFAEDVALMLGTGLEAVQLGAVEMAGNAGPCTPEVVGGRGTWDV